MASSDQVVDAQMCDAAKRDNSTQPCAQGPCIMFYWRARELADCLPEEASKPCGRVSLARLSCLLVADAPNVDEPHGPAQSSTGLVQWMHVL